MYDKAGSHCAYGSLLKDFFIRSFIPNGKQWFVIDNILSEPICRFCSWSLFSNIYRKINFIAKNEPDL